MNTEFPKSDKQFLKASVFQDQEIPLTFKGWEKKKNEDYIKDGKVVATWKQRIKYVLRYSYPEYALDEAGEKIIKDGHAVKNRNFDPQCPQGYSINYLFEEGKIESGSMPLFNAFCLVRPKPGDVITIKRTGKDKETKWTVKKLQKGEAHASSVEEPDFGAPEFSGDPTINMDEECPF